MRDALWAAVGVAAAITVMLPVASCGGQETGVSWAACQDAGEAMKHVNTVLEDHQADGANGDDVAAELQEAQTRMEHVAEDARAGDVTREAARMAEGLGDLSDGYTDRDDETIRQASATFAGHAENFIESCRDAWGRQM